MAPQNNEQRDAKVNEGDLNLDDVGVVLAHRTYNLDPRSLPMIILAIVTAGIAYEVFRNVAQTITALVIALLFALALDPIITKVQYFTFDHVPLKPKFDEYHKPIERMGRYQAVTIVLGTFLIVISLGAYIIAPKVVSQVKNFTKEIPETVHDMRKLPIVGKQLGSQKTQDNIKKALRELPKKLSAKNSPIAGVLHSIVNGALLGFLFVIMFVTLLLDGPRIVRNTRRLIPPEHRDAADRIARATYRVIGKYMAGSIFVASLAGLVVGTSALILGVPLAPLLGIWITFTNLIPQIGGLLGGAPFVLFGFTVSPLTGIICLAIFLIYQQIENHLIQPIVVGKTVKISPPVTMVAALIGVAAGGVLGAMLAVPFVGATKALAAEFDFPRGAREKALNDEELKQVKKSEKKSLREKLRKQK
jgi:predicted PurR-regulated permease PerM